MKNRIIILLIFLIPTLLFSNELDIFNSYEIRKNKFTNFKDAEFFIEEGKIKYNENDLISAKEFYIKGLELATNPEWYYILGDILYDLKEYDTSMKSYQLAGDLDYNRKDLAYYNAACSASLNKDEYHSYYYLQMALASGYNFWNHIENDSDLDLIKTTDTFNRLLAEYHIPDILIEYEEEFPFDLYLDSLSFEVNLFGDNENELIFYCHIDGINDPLGSYFFCLYCKKSSYWELMNKTIPKHISIPDNESTFRRIIERIDLDISVPPFIVSNLDNDLDREMLIPSGGMTYNSAKILDIQNGKLIEIGEIEGFEEIFPVNDELYLVGHQVTDFGYGSGTSCRFPQNM